MKIKKLCLALVAAGLLVVGGVAFGVEVYTADGSVRSADLKTDGLTSGFSDDNPKISGENKILYFDSGANDVIETLAKASTNKPDLSVKSDIELKDGSKIVGYPKAVVCGFRVPKDVFDAFSEDIKTYLKAQYNVTEDKETNMEILTIKNLKDCPPIPI